MCFKFNANSRHVKVNSPYKNNKHIEIISDTFIPPINKGTTVGLCLIYCDFYFIYFTVIVEMNKISKDCTTCRFPNKI